MRADKILENLAELYREKNKAYGNSYHETGRVWTALFPNGMGEISTENDFKRMCLMVFIINKLQRYCNNYKRPNNDDHLRDLAVYATMLVELDYIMMGEIPTQ